MRFSASVPPARLRARSIVAAVVAALALGACSGASGSGLVADVSDDGAPATTSVVRAATSPGVVAKPASSVSSDEVAVRKAYADFLAMVPVVADPPNPEHPLIAATTTGALKARLVEALTARRTNGRRSKGGYRSSVPSVVVTGDTASILDCSLDESVGIGPDGQWGVADTQWFVRSSQLVRTSDGWRMAEFVKGDPCAPA